METPALNTIVDLALVRLVIVKDLEKALSSHGVGLSDFALLTELYNAPDYRLRRTTLADRLGVTPSGIARQVGPLERIGLIDREADERDARIADVVLKKAGKRTVEELREGTEHRAAAALDRHWTAAEQDHLATLLRKPLASR